MICEALLPQSKRWQINSWRTRYKSNANKLKLGLSHLLNALKMFFTMDRDFSNRRVVMSTLSVKIVKLFSFTLLFTIAFWLAAMVYLKTFDASVLNWSFKTAVGTTICMWSVFAGLSFDIPFVRNTNVGRIIFYSIIFSPHIFVLLNLENLGIEFFSEIWLWTTISLIGWKGYWNGRQIREAS